MEDIKLIAATVNDIPAISALAKIVWNQHYPAIISQQQIDYMLNLMYSDQSMLEQMEKKGHLFYLVYKGNTLAGFISVNREQEDRWFLNKFYINQELAAKGIGARAFALLRAEIKPSQITLTVNRQNYKSVNFYFRNGFKIERVTDMDIGNGYVMDDFVMVWTA